MSRQVVKINVCYWKEKVPGSYSISNQFPCFIQLEPKEAEHDIYGLPSNEYPGLMKVSERYWEDVSSQSSRMCKPSRYFIHFILVKVMVDPENTGAEVGIHHV